MIQYQDAPDIKKRVEEIIELLMFDHVRSDQVYCIRSHGSRSKKTIARIHGLSRIWQEAMGIKPTYLIEVIHEKFDNCSVPAQDRALIHELMHIPQGFGGGFRHHKNYVTYENVDVWYKRYRQKRKDFDMEKR